MNAEEAIAYLSRMPGSVNSFEAAAATLREQDAEVKRLRIERDALASDCQILLSQIDYLIEASGESLDREDADLVAAIRGRFQQS